MVLLDLILPDGHGYEVLQQLRTSGCDAPVIVITSAGSISMAVESMRAGAYDFLVKPFSPERLQVTLNNALELRRLKRLERDLVQEPVRPLREFHRRLPGYARGLSHHPRRPRRVGRRSSSPARAVPARSWRPRRSIGAAHAPAGPSLP